MCSTAHDVTLSLNCTDTYQASIQYSLLSDWTGRQATKTKTRREEYNGGGRREEEKRIFSFIVKGRERKKRRRRKKRQVFT